MEEDRKQGEERESSVTFHRNPDDIRKEAGSLKSKLLWTVVFVIIAALTLLAITSNGGFSFSEFVGFMKSLDPFWLSMAFLSMICIILFEALAIRTITKAFGYKRSVVHNVVYSSGDIYFSAITPSASGGQPASAYFMMRDGIPGPTVTVALVVNLILYTFGILILGILAFCMNPAIFLNFSTFSKVLIIIGCVMLCIVAFAFILILVKSSILHWICNFGLGILSKLHLIRNVDKKKRKLADSINSYASNVSQLGGKRAMLIRALLLNVFQRASAISVPLFVFFAAGGSMDSAVDVWVAQCMVILGSNTVPIPGAMGVSDFLFIDVLSAMGSVGAANAMNINLLSRTVSFYSCVLICGIVMIIRMVSYKVVASRKNKMKID